jgi:hypothetical protein
MDGLIVWYYALPSGIKHIMFLDPGDGPPKEYEGCPLDRIYAPSKTAFYRWPGATYATP